VEGAIISLRLDVVCARGETEARIDDVKIGKEAATDSSTANIGRTSRVICLKR
jgi:hypothetical protein